MLKMIKSIYGRTLLLIALLLLLSLGGLALFRQYNQVAVDQHLAILSEEKRRLLQRVTDSMGEKMRAFSFDYSYWDEFVGYLNHPTSEWYEENIEASLKTFDVQAVWIYNKELAKVNSLSAFHTPEGKPYEPTQEILALLQGGKWFNRFFVRLQEGYLELRTAPIQPTADAERKTKPQGYFVTGMLWDEQVLKRIEAMTESSVTLTEATGGVASAAALKRSDEHGILASVALYGLDDKPLALLSSETKSKLTAHLLKTEDNLLLFIFLFVLLLFGIVSLFLFWHLYIPLKLISRSFAGSDPQSVKSLTKKKSEFGSIARLMTDFFEQKKKLTKEVELRAQAEEEIRSALQEKEVLLHEVHHRVRNNLQLLQSLMDLQRGSTKEETVRFSLSSATSRIRSLSLIHEGLYNQDLFSRILISDYVQKLCRELANQLGRNGKIRLDIEAEAFYVDLDTAVPLGLALNELVRNAFLHGFSDSETGTIRVELRREADGIRMVVEDDGNGFPDASLHREPSTLGLTLVQTLARQLQGDFRVEETETYTRTILEIKQ